MSNQPQTIEPGCGPELPSQSLHQAQQQFTRAFVERALRINGGRKSRTARYLGISREGLYKLMRRMEIE